MRLCGGKGGEHDLQLQAQRKEDLQRKRAEVAEAHRKQLGKAAKQQAWIQRAQQERVRTIAQLHTMLNKASCAGKKLKILQDQVRFRMEVDGNKTPVEGKWLSGRKAAEYKQLQPLVEAMIKAEKGAVPSAVVVPVRVPRQPAPNATDMRRLIDEGYRPKNKQRRSWRC
jgi:hypothetical protein